MRRFVLIALAVILGSVAAFAGYVMWDYDPDNESPSVAVPSYAALFAKAVRERSGAESYDALDPARKLRVLGDILAARTNEPAREVALFKLRELPDRDAAFALLRKQIDGLRDNQYEVAIASAATLATPKAKAYLDSLYRKLTADPAAHTPLGDYRASTFIVRRAEPDVAFAFQELSRTDADYSLASTREMALFFPTDPEYLVSMPNADDQLAAFNDSRFMKTLDGSPVPKDAWSLPMLRTLASLRARLDETMGFMAPYFSPERFFRDGVMLAKYQDAYLIASYKDKNVKVAETLIDIFGKLGGNFAIKRWDVNGVTVNSVQNSKSGKNLNYALVGDYFVVSTDTGLISRSVRTYQTERENSIAIDPTFIRSYSSVDPTGNREILYAWFNPTAYFGITGSASPAGRRLAVVARALGKPIVVGANTPAMTSALPSTIGWTVAKGEDPALLWQYVVNVRSLGKNPIDSLARLARMDVAKQIVPYFAPAMAVGYAGIDHLKEGYGYSNTAFNVVLAVPLRNAPAKFDSTMKILFARITSLVYTPEPVAGGGTRLWIAADTATNDSVLRARKLQPSFAVVNGMLLVASTPALLRSTVAALPAGSAAGSNPAVYFQGALSVGAFADNATRYVKTYLLRRDLYSPGEISGRIDPLRTAFGVYDRIEWSFDVANGLRRGQGSLIAKR